MQTGKPFDVFVVFLPKGQPLAGKALGLVAKIRDGKADGATQNLQARQLREELRRWAASESAVSARPENAPTKAGVTLRGVRFPWRDHARTTNFSAEKPGVIMTARENGSASTLRLADSWKRNLGLRAAGALWRVRGRASEPILRALLDLVAAPVATRPPDRRAVVVVR